MWFILKLRRTQAREYDRAPGGSRRVVVEGPAHQGINEPGSIRHRQADPLEVREASKSIHHYIRGNETVAKPNERSK